MKRCLLKRPEKAIPSESGTILTHYRSLTAYALSYQTTYSYHGGWYIPRIRLCCQTHFEKRGTRPGRFTKPSGALVERFLHCITEYHPMLPVAGFRMHRRLI